VTSLIRKIKCIRNAKAFSNEQDNFCFRLLTIHTVEQLYKKKIIMFLFIIISSCFIVIFSQLELGNNMVYIWLQYKQ